VAFKVLRQHFTEGTEEINENMSWYPTCGPRVELRTPGYKVRCHHRL